MEHFNPQILKHLFIPDPSSHKGQNGKLMIIGGSKLFHAAPLWSLQIATKIVDMVFFSSIEENNQIIEKLKEEFRGGIIVPRNKIGDYINEVDCLLIGPGLPRKDGEEEGDVDTKELTETLLKKYPDKRWIIDGGSLQVIDPELIPHEAILTPHGKEFEALKSKIKNDDLRNKLQNLEMEDQVKTFAKKFQCLILLKGPIDILSDGEKTIAIKGGNAGMTKGGTGDVLAGLIAALNSKNPPFLAASGGSYINKKAGERLFERVGYYYNASDLINEIPIVMGELLNS